MTKWHHNNMKIAKCDMKISDRSNSVYCTVILILKPYYAKHHSQRLALCTATTCAQPLYIYSSRKKNEYEENNKRLTISDGKWLSLWTCVMECARQKRKLQHSTSKQNANCAKNVFTVHPFLMQGNAAQRHNLKQKCECTSTSKRNCCST